MPFLRASNQLFFARFGIILNRVKYFEMMCVWHLGAGRFCVHAKSAEERKINVRIFLELR